MSRIDIYLLDDSNNTKEDLNLRKPLTYKKLIEQIRQNFKSLPKYYEIFILDKNNKEIKINNEKIYSRIGDILFIREIDNKERDKLKHSLFEINYEKLSESSKEILNDKYNCKICTFIIKHEKPFFCYECQKIFHEKCLKQWDKRCKAQNKKLACPTCRNKLPLEKWNKKLDYEDNRHEDANLMNKINGLKDNQANQNNLIASYIDKTIEIFKNILTQINTIHALLKLKNNDRLKYLITKNQLYFNNNEIDEISKIIHEELEQFIVYIKNNNKIILNKNINNYGKMLQKKHISMILSYDNKTIFKNDLLNSLNNDIEIQKDNNINNYSIEKRLEELKIIIINLNYFVNTEGNYDIFGKIFVENNKDNIEILLNGKENLFKNNYKLKSGKNIISIIIKNKITNLSYMFYKCELLKNISELEYLDVNDSTNFSYMFYGCSNLTDIKSLENWNVSNGKDFTSMFSSCSSLSDIKPLKNWNVSNGKDFTSMFEGCSQLLDIKPLENWNISNGINFNKMFSGCSQLLDINSLNNWKIEKNKLSSIC